MKIELKKNLTIAALVLMTSGFSATYAADDSGAYVKDTSSNTEYCRAVQSTPEMAAARTTLQRKTWPGQGFNAAVNGIGSNVVVKGTPEMAAAHAALQRETWSGQGFNAAVNGIGSNVVVKSTPEMAAAHAAIQPKTGSRGFNAAVDGIGCQR